MEDGQEENIVEQADYRRTASNHELQICECILNPLSNHFTITTLVCNFRDWSFNIGRGWRVEIFEKLTFFVDPLPRIQIFSETPLIP